MITQEKLKEILEYNPDTGDFFWRNINFTNSIKSGDKAGSYNNLGYCKIKINNKLYLAHRLAWLYVYGKFPKHTIDHIDHNTSNIKLSNLRDIKHIDNMENQSTARVNNKTGLLGVYKRSGKHPYRAQIQVKGRKMMLGSFKTAEEAYEAYLNAKRKYHKFNTL